jgi:WD40 repeat protein
MLLAIVLLTIIIVISISAGVITLSEEQTSPELVSRVTTQPGINAVALSFDGTLMAALFSSGVLTIRQVPSFDELATWQVSNSGGGYHISFVPQSNIIIVSDREGMITGWDMHHRKPKYQFAFQRRTNSPVPAQVRMVAVHASQPLAAVGSDIGEVILFHPVTGDIFQRWQWRTSDLCVDCSHSIRSLALSSDGELLAFGISTGEIILWDIANEHVVRSFKTAGGFPRNIAFSNDNQFLSVFHQNTVLARWAIDSGDLTHKMEIEIWDFPGATFMHGDAQLAYGGPTYQDAFTTGLPLIGPKPDPNIYIHDVSSGVTLRVLKGHTAIIRGLSWNDATNMLLSGSEDGVLMLWAIDM